VVVETTFADRDCPPRDVPTDGLDVSCGVEGDRVVRMNARGVMD